jgi:hypothetical protein
MAGQPDDDLGAALRSSVNLESAAQARGSFLYSHQTKVTVLGQYVRPWRKVKTYAVVDDGES